MPPFMQLQPAEFLRLLQAAMQQGPQPTTAGGNALLAAMEQAQLAPQQRSTPNRLLGGAYPQLGPRGD